MSNFKMTIKLRGAPLKILYNQTLIFKTFHVYHAMSKFRLFKLIMLIAGLSTLSTCHWRGSILSGRSRKDLSKQFLCQSNEQYLNSTKHHPQIESQKSWQKIHREFILIFCTCIPKSKFSHSKITLQGRLCFLSGKNQSEKTRYSW